MMQHHRPRLGIVVSRTGQAELAYFNCRESGPGHPAASECFNATVKFSRSPAMDCDVENISTEHNLRYSKRERDVRS